VRHLRRELRRVVQSALHQFLRARGTKYSRQQKETKVTKFHCSVLGQDLCLLRYLLFKVSSTGLPSLIVQGERKQKSSFRLAAETSRLAACAPQREVRLRGTRKVRGSPRRVFDRNCITGETRALPEMGNAFLFHSVERSTQPVSRRSILFYGG